MAAYESNDLALDLDNENHLFKAEKVVERRSKQKRAASAGNKRVYFAKGGPITPRPSARTEGSSLVAGAARTPSVRSRPFGPCFGSGQFGHLVDSCSVRAPRTYPFPQPIIGKDGCESVFCDASVLSCVSLNYDVGELGKDGCELALGEESVLPYIGKFTRC